MNMIKALLCCLLLILIAGISVNALANTQEIDRIVQLFGGAGICIDKAKIPSSEADGEKVGRKLMETYVAMGVNDPNILLENIHIGAAMGGSADAAQCLKLLEAVLPMVRDFGLDEGPWKKAIAYYGGKEEGQAGAAQSKTALPFNLGVYQLQEAEMGSTLTFLRNGRGINNLGDEEAPFTWRIDGNKIMAHFMNAPKDQANAVFQLTGPDSFSWDKMKFSRDDEVKIREYDYAEPGYTGNLTIFDYGYEHLPLEINTASEKGDTCELKLTCMEKAGALICRDSDNSDPDAALILKESTSSAQVETTLSNGDYCGTSGYFAGAYKK